MYLFADKSVFAGLPSPFEAIHYRSRVIERVTLPDSLEITAESEDGLIMGMRHKTRQIHGVQLHPGNIAPEHGHTLFKNFIDYIGA